MIRAYVSSTAHDLQPHRAAALQALRKMGHVPVAMEDYVADARLPLAKCLQDVAAADLYLGLFAWRYGYVPDGHDTAITEAEYREAVRRGIPRLIFLLRDDAPWPDALRDAEPERRERIRALRDELKKNYVVSFFTTPEDLTRELMAAVHQYLARNGALEPDRPRTNLQETPSLIGRADEVRQLREWFAGDDRRLVTLLGPAGIGKTRLARHLSGLLLERFAGGCWFADLTEARTAAGVAGAVAEALGVPLRTGEAPEDVVAQVLRMRPPLLVILDNFEQVVEHAGATVEAWLRAAPRVRFLVTSREPLASAAEHTYQVDPLDVPPAHTPFAEAGAWESVQLFVERARQRQNAFQLTEANAAEVVQVCRELEGNPLALELAAARIRDYPPRAMLAQLKASKLKFLKTPLRGVRPRQAALSAAIDWSFQLLTDWEKEAFLQACVFQGGFFPELARPVLDLAAFPAAPADTLEILGRLRDRGLLRQEAHDAFDEPRFGLYVALREFGQERWAARATPEEQERLRGRWAWACLAYAEHWAARVAEGEPIQDRLVLEMENVFAVQEWALAAGDAVLAAQVLLAYADTLEQRGPAPERRPRFQAVLAALARQPDPPPELRARLLLALADAGSAVGAWDEAFAAADGAVAAAEASGRLALRAAALRKQGDMRTSLGHNQEAMESLARSRALYEQLQDASGVAWCDLYLSMVHEQLGDRDESLRLLDQVVRHARGANARLLLARAHNRRGITLWHYGEPERALPLLEQAECIARELHSPRWVAGCLTNQGLVLTDLEEFDRAEACFRRADVLHHEQFNKAWTAVNLGSWGQMLMRQGKGLEALELLEEAGRLAREVDYPQDVAMHAGNQGRVLLELGRPADARAALAEALRIEAQLGQKRMPRYFGNLVTLARAAAQLGDQPRLRALLPEARRLATELGLTPEYPVRQIRDDLWHLERLEGGAHASA